MIKNDQVRRNSKFILNKLNSSQYKASSIPKSLFEKISKSIDLTIKHQNPIHNSIPFGGFKKHQLPSYPYPDWSEIFTILQIYNYVLPIAEAYSKGVIIDFWSDELFISKMNNLRQTDIDKYNNCFKQILIYFNKFTRPNIKFKFSKIRDHISQEEIFKRFEKTKITLKREWYSYTKEVQEKKLKKAERNYNQDWTNVTLEEKRSILFQSNLIHDAFILGDWDKDIHWAFDEDMIPVGFCYTGDWGIHIKSTPTSTNQFWVGIGAIKTVNNIIYPTSLTYNQFNNLNVQKVKISVFPKEFNNLDYIYKVIN